LVVVLTFFALNLFIQQVENAVDGTLSGVRLEAVLEMRQVLDTVNEKAAAPLLQTSDATEGAVGGNQQIGNLLLNRRDYPQAPGYVVFEYEGSHLIPMVPQDSYNSVYTRPWTLASSFHRGHAKERACNEGKCVADSIVDGTR